MAYPDWSTEGYLPQYRFVRSGMEGDSNLYDITSLPLGSDITGQGIATGAYGALPVVDPWHPEWSNPAFQYDLARWLQAASGQPGSGWAQGENAGQGQTIWSGILESIPFLVAAGVLGAGAIGGAGAGAGGAGAGAGELGTAATFAGPAVEGASAFGGPVSVGTAGVGAGAAGAGGIGGGAAAGAGGSGAGGLSIVPGADSAVLSGAGGAGTSSGIFGTGITAGQAVRGGLALGTGIAGLAGASGGGGSSGGGGGTGDTTGTTQNPDIDANREWARRLAIESIAPRLAQFQEGINSLTQLANASPMALTQRLSPQIEQARSALKQMFQQSAQRFGPFGGGETEREQVRGAEAIGGRLGGLFTAVPSQAREAIGKLIENFQTIPQPAAQIMSTNIGNTTQPFNPASVLASLQSGAALGRVGNRVGTWLDTPSGGQGGAYGGLSQGYDQYSIPYDYGFGV